MGIFQPGPAPVVLLTNLNLLDKMNGYSELEKIGYGDGYAVPRHAVKIWKKVKGGRYNAAAQTQNCAHEAAMLKHLSESAHTSQYVPKFIYHDAANDELHMELLEGY